MKSQRLTIEKLQDRALMAADLMALDGCAEFGWNDDPYLLEESQFCDPSYAEFSDPDYLGFGDPDPWGVIIDHTHFDDPGLLDVNIDHIHLDDPNELGDFGIIDFDTDPTRENAFADLSSGEIWI